MNLRNIEYFLAVAELEHFGKAARRCCVSQPTLSGQIRKLEEELGVRLFERSNRRVMLTEAGRSILPPARRVFIELESVKRLALTAADPTAGVCRLGAIPTLASYVFPDLVLKLKAKLPRLQLVLMEEKTEELISKLGSGELDAALLALPLSGEFLESSELFKDRFLVALPEGHALASKSSIDAQTLSEQKLLLLEEGHCLREQSLEVCNANVAPEQGDFTATSLETLRNMVRAGNGVTLIPEIAVSGSDKGVCYIPLKSATAERTIVLAWRKTSTKKQLFEHVKSCFPLASQ